jgi:hypothetical protein
MSIDLLSNILYWSLSYSLFDRLYVKYDQKKEYLNFYGKVLDIFGATCVNSVLISLFIYPLDTFKRHLQVNNGFGFNKEYSSVLHGVKTFIASPLIDKYRGFSFHLIKTIPFSFVHYTLYVSARKYFEVRY